MATKKKPSFKPGFRVGLVGGGQLARMLALKGHEMGMQVAVLSASASDPAAQVSSRWVKGNPTSKRDLMAFFRQVDVVSFESEFYPADLFAQVARRSATQVKPAPRIMGLLQDRLSQKRLFTKYRIPTAEFVALDTTAEARAAFDRLGPCVFKTRMGGYDGYGTHIVKTRAALAAFTRKRSPVHFIAERFIPFKAELAVSLARNARGQFTVLPLVRTFQQDARCLWVKGPVKHRGFSALTARLKRMLTAEKYEGIIAFELFDSREGLIVNEAAPRVHNSAHYSLDALDEDQFTLHLKAVAGAALPKTAEPKAKGFAMWNLLGTKTRTPVWRYPHGTHLHWYGKSANRPGRKMGHISAVAATPDAALSRVKRAAKEIHL
jgi:5-(carboxyamino)imidazole ribonucleotide synthase